MSSPNLFRWNCYLLASEKLISGRQEVLDFLDTVPEVVNWRATQGIILVVTNLEKRPLTAKLREKFPDMRLILSDVGLKSTDGWTDKETWDFINTPSPVASAKDKPLGK